MKKTPLLSALFFGAALALAGCSSPPAAQPAAPASDPASASQEASPEKAPDAKAPASDSQEEEIVLTIGSAMVTEDPEGGVEQEIANRYMAEHPNVKIEFISMPAPEVSKRIVTQAATGDMPDMFFVPNDFMPQLYDVSASKDGVVVKQSIPCYTTDIIS